MSNKFKFIDGLRGLAACQVVLLHYCAAFLPGLARVDGTPHFLWEASISQSPLFWLIDGYSAVYLFFIMSGFVLAPSFIHSEKHGAGLVLKRFVRLYVPVLAASLLALVLLLLLPEAKTSALDFSRSDWLAGLGHNPLSAVALAKDIFLNSMLIGYSGTSVFDSVANLLPQAIAPSPMSQALNTPAWTLHVEFWGSMLVLALAMLWRSLERRVFWTVFAGVVLVAGSSHFSLFLFGFFLFHAYSSTKSDKANPLHAGIGALLIMAGLYVCTVKNTALLSATLGTLSHLTWMDASSNFQWQSQVGAMLVFSGVLLTVPAQNWLARPLAKWLGQVSFSVYLLHFPIMMTVGCAVFAWLPSSYALACALSAFVGIVLTFLLAALFEKFVDRPSVRWSKQLGGGF